ncbi:hypothetical protein [Robiginitalea sp. SC105]|nr:hypothetical protein [Robiginitalea sp. SC105]
MNDKGHTFEALPAISLNSPKRAGAISNENISEFIMLKTTIRKA